MRNLFVFLIATLISVASFGKTTSTNGSGTDWATAANWNNGLPALGDVVNVNHAMTVGSSTTALAGDLTVASSITLTIDGSLKFNGTITNNGTISASGGAMEFSGTVQEYIDGNDFSVGEFTISGANGEIGIKNNLSVEGCVYLKSGKIETNFTGAGTFTLDENAAGTKKGRICEASGGEINGDYEQNFVLYITNSASAHWGFVGAGVTGQTMGDWNIIKSYVSNGTPRFYDNSLISSGGNNGEGWDVATSNSNTTDRGQGFIAWEYTINHGSGKKVQSLTGTTAYLTDWTYTLTRNSSAGTTPYFQGGWNLLANPYAGTFELDEMSFSSTGCQCQGAAGNGKVYVWNSDKPGGPDYIDFNYYTSFSADGFYELAEGQAFWVEANTSTQAASFKLPYSGITNTHKYLDKRSNRLEYIEFEVNDDVAALYFVNGGTTPTPPTLYPDQDNGVWDSRVLFAGYDSELVCVGTDINSGSSADDYNTKTSTITTSWQEAYVKVRETLDPESEEFSMTVTNNFECESDPGCTEIQVWNEGESTWVTVGARSSQSVTHTWWVGNGNTDDEGMKTVLKVRFRDKP